jgi:hypothetical protein
LDNKEHLSLESMYWADRFHNLWWLRVFYFQIGLWELVGLFAAGAVAQIPWILVKVSGRPRVSTIVFQYAVWLVVYSLLVYVFRGRSNLRGVPTIFIIVVVGSFLTTFVIFTRNVQSLHDFYSEMSLFLAAELMFAAINIMSIAFLLTIVRTLKRIYLKRN